MQRNTHTHTYIYNANSSFKIAMYSIAIVTSVCGAQQNRTRTAFFVRAILNVWYQINPFHQIIGY